MSETEVRVILAEGVVIGPDDRLVVKVMGPNLDPDEMYHVREEIDKIIGEGRTFLLWGSDDYDIQLAKVEAE